MRLSQSTFITIKEELRKITNNIKLLTTPDQITYDQTVNQIKLLNTPKSQNISNLRHILVQFN